MADQKTGIVLTTEGDYDTGKGKAFKVFENIQSAKEYCSAQLLKYREVEFVIYNGQGQIIKGFDELTGL